MAENNENPFFANGIYENSEASNGFNKEILAKTDNKANNVIRDTKDYTEISPNIKKATKKGSKMAAIAKKIKIIFAAIFTAGIGYLGADALYKGSTEQVVNAKDSVNIDDGTYTNLQRGSELTGTDMAEHVIYANPGITTEQLQATLSNKQKVDNYMNNNGATPHVTSVGERAVSNVVNSITGVSNADKLTKAQEIVENNYDIAQKEDGTYNVTEKTGMSK